MKGWIGLCLALTILATGCNPAPSVAFSRDGKFVVHQLPKHGFAIRNAADGSLVSRYDVGSAFFLTWSPNGNYLIWSDTPPFVDSRESKPKTRLLDVAAKKVTLLPISFGGPFAWSRDEESVTGFEILANEKEDKDIPFARQIRFDIGSKSSDTHDIGRYLPIGAFPDSESFVVVGQGAVSRLTGHKVTKLYSFSGEARWDPAAITLLNDGGVIVCEQRINSNGIENRAMLASGGKSKSLSLPPSISNSRLRRNSVSRLVGISHDMKWLIVQKQVDRSPRKILATALIAHNGFNMSHKQLQALRHKEWELRQQEKVDFVFEMVDRLTGVSHPIGESKGASSAIGFGQLEESPDGRHLSYSFNAIDCQLVWLIDRTTSQSLELLRHEGEID